MISEERPLMNKIKLAILASGNGSNAEAIMKWAVTRKEVEVVCLISDKKKAKVLERALNFEVPPHYIKKESTDTRESYDQKILSVLNIYKPQWIILAGYMKILSKVFLEKFENRVVNIHPSLLPSFPGLDGYADALNSGVKVTGCTVHYVDEGIDTGKIIAQKEIQILPGDSLSDLKARGLLIENDFYPKTLEEILLK